LIYGLFIALAIPSLFRHGATDPHYIRGARRSRFASLSSLVARPKAPAAHNIREGKMFPRRYYNINRVEVVCPCCRRKRCGCQTLNDVVVANLDTLAREHYAKFGVKGVRVVADKGGYLDAGYLSTVYSTAAACKRMILAFGRAPHEEAAPW
jgi:hypothetical protein